jgi:hypothetical protein
MSNRTQTSTDFAAELRVAHLAQIDALTRPGLTDDERKELFGKAADFNRLNWCYVNAVSSRRSAAYAVWTIGSAPKSLFGNLPGCRCPVSEKLPGVPHNIELDWYPTVAELERFSEIQIERRCR